MAYFKVLPNGTLAPAPVANVWIGGTATTPALTRAGQQK
jgi:hypothetical protein